MLKKGRWLIAAALATASCGAHISQTRPATSCLTLIPRAWLAPTPGASLPLDRSVGSWMVFGDAQTGQLDLANAGKVGMVEILTACEARDAETVKALTPRRRVLGLF